MISGDGVSRRRPSTSYSARLLGSKWNILIIRELTGGPRRFSELQAALAGISPRTLSDRLRWLKTEKVVSRTVYSEVPPRVEYALTVKGRALGPVLTAMKDYERVWGPPDGPAAHPPGLE
ncbi:MAG: transcriptional regulator [Bacillota bacterium]|nr:MAG: transcriptional regulator [Bacillota bacterium]